MRPLGLIALVVLLQTSNSSYCQHLSYRSDSVSTSLMFRFFIITLGGGIEVPFRQSSIGTQIGINYISNMQYDFDKVFAVAVEYKRHIRTQYRSPYYWGGYLLYRKTDHGTPEEGGWDGEWVRSTSRCAGILGGIKIYTNPRVYFDLFTGIHGGMRDGTRRWTDNLPSGGYSAYENDDSRPVLGVRLGLTLGFHLFRKTKVQN